MSDTTNKPVIFLAFANDRDDTVGYLRNLPDEARRLRDVLEQAERDSLCEVVVRSNSTAGDVFKVFQDSRYRNRIAIFHYGGHANGYQLLLESSEGQAVAADAGGLAAFLAQQQGLQLVFLNGCSTQQQTQTLLDANVSAVISTSRAIDDQVATDFACQFYQGLAGGATIRTAYNEAEAAVQTAKGGNMRALYFGGLDDSQSQPEADRWPWDLYLREGSENAAQWNLPEAVNDPLFGLPPLPEQDLPESPYRHLNWFTRKDAEVFFGRGYQIRELYDRLTAPRTAPILLFYGQSGVGKSSILAAGLLPRLEQDHEIRYLRRTQGGLLDTLQLAFLPEASDVLIEKAWQAKEEQVNKPLIVFLDQVEEVYTRPIADLPDELDHFLGVLKATFGDANCRPRGKLVLGFRKEWLAELESHLVDYELPRTKVFLEPLDRRGVIEAVQGPAQSERLRERYGLTVENGLAETIADDLLEDRGSAIAPTLQILLTKMWSKATEANYDHPHFSLDLYQHLKRDGILLTDFLSQQISACREQYPDAVDSGLLLDILAVHTTPLGTADQCTVEQLQEQYAHLPDVLPDLLRHAQDVYLLTVPVGTQKGCSRSTRLAHDTLAPLVREQFDVSDRPGQRARRTLDAKSRDWHDGKVGAPLDAADLRTVEAGAHGTRAWSDDETRLVELSRKIRTSRQWMRRIVRAFLIAAVVLIAVSAGVAAWKWYEAANFSTNLTQKKIELEEALVDARTQQVLSSIESAKLLTTEGISSLSRHDTPAAAHRFALAIKELESIDLSELQLDESVKSRIESMRKNNRVRLRILDQRMPTLFGSVNVEEPVVDVRFASTHNELIVQTNSAVEVRDSKSGEVIAVLRESGKSIDNVWYGPGTTLVAAFKDDPTPVVWDYARGAVVARPEAHNASLLHVEFSVDGKLAITTGREFTAYTWDLPQWSRKHSLRRHESSVLHAAFSSDGKFVATACLEESVRVWSTETGELLHKWSDHPTGAKYVEFRSDGTELMTLPYTSPTFVGGTISTPSLHDDSVRVFSLAEDKLRLDLSGHFDGGLDGQFAGGDRIISSSKGSKGGGVDFRVWNTEQGVEVFHVSDERMVAISKCKRHVVTFATDGRLRVRSTHDGELLSLIPGEYERYLSLDPKQRWLAAGADDGSVTVLNPTVAQIAFRIQGLTTPVSRTTFSPDGHLLATLHGGTNVLIWQMPSPHVAEIADDLPFSRPVLAASLDAIGTASDEEIVVRDLVTGREFRPSIRKEKTPVHPGLAFLAGLRRETTEVPDLFFSPRGTHVVAARLPDSEGKPSSMTLWGFRDQQSAQSYSESFGGFLPDGQFFVSSTNNSVFLRITATGKVVWQMPVEHCKSARISGSGQEVLVVCSTGPQESVVVRVLDAMKGEELSRVPSDGTDRSITNVALDSNSEHLFVHHRDRQSDTGEKGGAKTRISVVSLSTLEVLASLDLSETLKGMTIGDIVRMWSCSRCRHVANFHGTNLKVAAGGKRALTSSDNRTLLWDTDTGARLAVLDRNNSIVQSSFSNDGSLIASISTDGTVLLWDGHTGATLGGLFEARQGIFSLSGDEAINGALYGYKKPRDWRCQVFFPPGEDHLGIQTSDGAVGLFRVNPLALDFEALTLRQEVLSGTTFTDTGDVTFIPVEALENKRAELIAKLEPSLESNYEVAIEAAAALLAVDSQHQPAITTLIDMVRNEDAHQLAREALLKSARGNKAFINSLSAAIRSSIQAGDWGEVKTYLAAAAAIGPQASPILAQVALDEEMRAPKGTTLDAVHMLGTAASSDSAAINQLVRILSVEDEQMALVAQTNLGRLGSPAVSPLRDLVASGNQVEKRRAIAALREMGREAAPAADVLTPLLGDNDETIRKTACDTLISFGQQSTPAVLKALEDSSEIVRFNAAVVLAGTKPISNDVVSLLVRLALADDIDDVRKQATHVLEVIRDEQRLSLGDTEKSIALYMDILLLTESLSPDIEMRLRAVETIAEIGRLGLVVKDEHLVEGLHRLLDDEDETCRRRVALALFRSGEFDTLVSHSAYGCGFMVESFDELDQEQKEDVAHSFRIVLSESHLPILPAICRLLKDPSDEVRADIADSIGNLGVHGEAAIPFLVTALKDESPIVRLEAVGALIAITGQHPDYIPVLVQLVALPPSDNWYDFRVEAAAELLQRMGPATESAVPRLCEIVLEESNDTTNRSAATEALLALKRYDDSASAFEHVWRDEGFDSELRIDAIKAWLSTGRFSDDIVPILEESLRPRLTVFLHRVSLDQIPSENQAAECLAICRDRSRRAASVFQSALNGSDFPTRVGLLCALLEVDAERDLAWTEFSRLLQHDDRNVREAAAHCIGAATAEHMKWAELLMNIVNDKSEDSRVRGASAASLRKYLDEGHAPMFAERLVAVLEQRAIAKPDDDSMDEFAASVSIELLGRLGEVAQPYLSRLNKLVEKLPNDSPHSLQTELRKALILIEGEP